MIRKGYVYNHKYLLLIKIQTLNEKNVLLWILAFVITAVTAVYQRVTGPTYPISNKIEIDNKMIAYKFARSHGGTTNHEVKIEANDNSIIGELYFKRYKTADDWQKLEMKILMVN